MSEFTAPMFVTLGTPETVILHLLGDLPFVANVEEVRFLLVAARVQFVVQRNASDLAKDPEVRGERRLATEKFLPHVDVPELFLGTTAKLSSH